MTVYEEGLSFEENELIRREMELERREELIARREEVSRELDRLRAEDEISRPRGLIGTIRYITGVDRTSDKTMLENQARNERVGKFISEYTAINAELDILANPRRDKDIRDAEMSRISRLVRPRGKNEKSLVTIDVSKFTDDEKKSRRDLAQSKGFEIFEGRSPRGIEYLAYYPTKRQVPKEPRVIINDNDIEKKRAVLEKYMVTSANIEEMARRSQAKRTSRRNPSTFEDHSPDF